jgi:hypothetical protein
MNRDDAIRVFLSSQDALGREFEPLPELKEPPLIDYSIDYVYELPLFDERE